MNFLSLNHELVKEDIRRPCGGRSVVVGGGPWLGKCMCSRSFLVSSRLKWTELQSVRQIYQDIKAIMMTSAGGRPPELSKLGVSTVVCRYFKFSAVNEDSVKSLPGYDDRNYYFEGTTLAGRNGQFIFKVFNCVHSSFSEIEGCNKLIRTLQATGILRQVPERSRAGPDTIQLKLSNLGNNVSSNIETVIATDHNIENSSGKHLVTVSGLDDSILYVVSILSFVPGVLLDNIDKKYLVHEVIWEIGTKMALMDKELKKFTNEAIESRQNIHWNLLYFLDMRKKIALIESTSKTARATLILDAFEKNVTPKLPKFERSIIQGDMNGLNIVMEKKTLIDGYQYRSFIDFGDTTKTCTVFELALGLTYIMAENLTPITCSNCFEFVRPMIDGYTSVLPLTKDELDCLYYLVLARCCQSAVNGEISYKQEPWNTYLLVSPGKSWILSDKLLEMTKEKVDQIWFQ